MTHCYSIDQSYRKLSCGDNIPISETSIPSVSFLMINCRKEYVNEVTSRRSKENVLILNTKQSTEEMTNDKNIISKTILQFFNKFVLYFYVLLRNNPNIYSYSLL